MSAAVAFVLGTYAGAIALAVALRWLSEHQKQQHMDAELRAMCETTKL